MDLTLNRQLIYTALTSISAFLFFYFSQNQQAVWLLYAALPLMCIVIDKSAWRRVLCIFLTGFIASTILLVFAAIESPLASFLVALLIIGGTVYFGLIYANYYLVSIYIALTVIVTSLLQMTFMQGISSGVYLLMGTTLSALWQVVFIYKEKQYRSNYLFNECLKELNQLQQTILTCLVEPNYSDKRYQFERRMHLQKYQFMRSAGEYAELSKENMAAQLLQLYSVLLESALIRWRISDFNIFSFGQKELQTISQALNQIFSSKFKQGLQLLNDSIDQLDDLYENILKVTAKEPLPVLLFVGSLRSMQNEIQAIRATMYVE